MPAFRQFAPIFQRFLVAGHVVEAPGTAPGSEWLITAAFIAIAGVNRQIKYMMPLPEKKVPC